MKRIIESLQHGQRRKNSNTAVLVYIGFMASKLNKKKLKFLCSADFYEEYTRARTRINAKLSQRFCTCQKLEHGPCCEPLAALSKVLITLHIATSVGHHLETIVTISARLMVFITVFYRLGSGTKRLAWTGGFSISHESFGEAGLRLPHFVACLWGTRGQAASSMFI